MSKNSAKNCKNYDCNSETNTLKSLSHYNGTVNNMGKDDIIRKMTGLGLNTNGCVDVLRKRLKTYHKRKILGGTKQCKYRYLCVIDFEATCEADILDYVHEIIEFPAVLVDVEKRQIVDEFHRFCRPVLNPCLTPFCQKLTGISQEQVDNASLFPDVLKEFETWSEKYRVKQKPYDNYFAIVTDGPWDMKRFFSLQCQHCDIEIPTYGFQWINIRKSFTAFYHFKGKLSLLAMLESLGLLFEGRPHCGLDDSKNIARILITLLSDGAEIKMNEKLDISLEGEKKEEKKKRFRSNSEINSNSLLLNLGVDPDSEGQEFNILSKSSHSKINKT